MENEYDEDDEVTPIPARRMRPIDLAVALVATIHQVLTAVADGIDKVVYLLASHANYKVQRYNFERDVRLELESLPTTEE